ncbi:MAG: efflux RND transporter permease subunit [Blastocatellia bacterium]|nr:efflux RND transporter permease subunit [Blastocatellia bacterium]
MIDKIIQFSVSQRLLVFLLVLLLIGMGVYSLQKLPIDAVPDVTNVQVQILTSAPSLAPLEVERQITFPIEIAVSGLPNVEEVRSVSKFGLSAITVVFKDSVDIYFARQLILERLAEAKEQIPQSIGLPELGPISTGLGEIYQYELKGEGYDPIALRTIQDWIVRRQLISVPGVAEVNSFGGLEKQYEVRLNPVKLQAYNLTLRDVLEALTKNNENVGGAYIEHAAEQYLLRGIGLIESIEDIENIVIKTASEGVPVYVRDLADVSIGSNVRQGAVTADGKGEIVAGIVMMLQGENSRSVVDRVKERVEQVKKSLPKGVELVPFYDRTELVNRTISTITINLVEGAAIVIIILILLLGNWRGALLVATVIPLSMLIAAIFMERFKVSGNLMSLGALDFGLIVDGAVIMVENTIRRTAERQHLLGRSLTKEELQATICSSASEVRKATLFGELIIAIVYLPILSLAGIEGKMFKPMAMTVIFALAGAMLLSFTFIPAALTIVLRGKVSEKESFIIHYGKKFYKTSLEFVMNAQHQALAISISLIVISLSIFPLLGSEFIPRLDEGALAVQAQKLPSVSISQAVSTTTDIEKALQQFPEVTAVVSKTGRPEIANDPMGIETSDIYVGLKPASQWTTTKNREELIAKMSEVLETKVPTAAISFSQPIELRVSELISGVKSDVAIKLFGEDLEILNKKGAEIAQIISKVAGATDVKVEQVTGLPQLQIKANREIIARYGINVSDINILVESLVAGKLAGQVFEGEQKFDLVVKMSQESSKSLETIKTLLVPMPNGAKIPLSQLASVVLVESPLQISREDAHRRIVVELNVRGRDIGSFVKEAQTLMDKELQLPAGYYLTWGGQFENLERATQKLLLVVPIAMLLIFVMLFTTFGSTRQALLIYTGIPFAAVGGILALALRDMPFSISAGVGFIALFGVAVLNGLVMMSAINALKKEGIPIEQAIKQGAESRFRPVLMTALVASLGFIPMALATSAGAEVQRPLATVVIGGLTTSTLLTLFILPTLCSWFGYEK